MPALPDGQSDSTSQVAVRADIGNGALEMAVALRGQGAHDAWTAFQMAPQRIAQMEQMVLNLEMSLVQEKQIAQLHVERAQREQMQQEAIVADAQQMLLQMADQHITWREAEGFARSVLFQRDCELQEEIRGEVQGWNQLSWPKRNKMHD